MRLLSHYVPRNENFLLSFTLVTKQGGKAYIKGNREEREKQKKYTRCRR